MNFKEVYKLSKKYELLAKSAMGTPKEFIEREINYLIGKNPNAVYVETLNDGDEVVRFSHEVPKEEQKRLIDTYQQIINTKIMRHFPRARVTVALNLGD